MNTRFGLPSGQFLDARFFHLEDLCEQVKMWNLDFRMLSACDEATEAGRVIQAGTGAVGYGYCALNASIDQSGSAPPGVVTFAIKGKETGRVWWRNLDTEADDILIYQPGSEVKCISGPRFSVQTVSASWDVIAGICNSMQLRLPRSSTLPETIRAEPTRLAAIQSLLHSIFTEMGVGFQETLMGILEMLVPLWVAQANTSTHARPSIRSRDRAIGTCLEFLDSADLQDTGLRHLREVSDVSERTLQYAFRERFGMTAQAFLRFRRLSRTRELIQLETNGSRSIGELAATQGLWHHGRFTADYKKLYGETPSETRSFTGSPISDRHQKTGCRGVCNHSW